MVLRLAWEPTYPNDAKGRPDFTARDLPKPPGFARVYFSPPSGGPRRDAWFWVVFRDGSGIVGRGYAPLKGDAMRLAEQALLGLDSRQAQNSPPAQASAAG